MSTRVIRESFLKRNMRSIWTSARKCWTKNDNWSECKSARRYYKDKAQRKAHENKENGKDLFWIRKKATAVRNDRIKAKYERVKRNDRMEIKSKCYYPTLAGKRQSNVKRSTETCNRIITGRFRKLFMIFAEANIFKPSYFNVYLHLDLPFGTTCAQKIFVLSAFHRLILCFLCNVCQAELLLLKRSFPSYSRWTKSFFFLSLKVMPM